MYTWAPDRKSWKGLPNYSESESHSVVSDSLRPHGPYSPWNSPGQKTGVGSLSLFQGIFQPRDRTQVPHNAGGLFTSWATREAHPTLRPEQISSPVTQHSSSEIPVLVVSSVFLFLKSEVYRLLGRLWLSWQNQLLLNPIQYWMCSKGSDYLS